MTKICNRCKAEKSLAEDFYADKRRRDGKYPHCKTCHNAVTRAWNEANLKRKRELGTAWKRANSEKNRASVAKRRATKLAHDGPHYAASDVEALLEQQQGRCFYCYDGLGIHHVDHIIPLSRGGGNGRDNIVLACPFCNLSKGNRLLGSEWVPPYRADANFLLAFSG